MSLEILFTDEASDMLVAVSTFIENKWGGNTANKFLDTAYQTFETVAQQPYIFKSSSLSESIRISLTFTCRAVYRSDVSSNFIAVTDE